MSDQLYDVISKVNDEQLPLVGTCTMVLGDGTVRAEFKNGRAKVPASVARLLVNHPNLDVIGFDSNERVSPAPATPAPDQPGVPDQGGSDLAEEIAARDARIAELEAMIAQNAAASQSPAFAPGAAPDGAVEVSADAIDAADEQELSPEVLAAMQHLAEEGEEVPEPGSDTPPPAADPRAGFEAATVDGQPRCQAAKGDGSQCSNGAQADSQSCHLPSHKKQAA
jgi:hypothetical protein